MEISRSALLGVVFVATLVGCSKKGDCTEGGYVECKRQCEADSDQACYEVGKFLYFGASADKSGSPVAQDESRALTYYEKACKGDIDDGCIMLSKALIDGRGTRADVNRAIEVAEPLCVKGKGNACALLVHAAETAGLDSSSARSRTVAAWTKECDSGHGNKGSPCWALAMSGWTSLDDAMKFGQAACEQGHTASLCQNKDELRAFVTKMHDRAGR